MDEERGDKLLCRDCGNVVTPNEVEDEDTMWYSCWYECPVCGHDNLTAYVECGNCMKPIPSGEEYCQDCIEEVKKVIRNTTEEYDNELRDIAMLQMLEG